MIEQTFDLNPALKPSQDNPSGSSKENIIANNISDQKKLLSLTARLFIFLLPIVLVLSSYELILWESGESWSLQHVLSEQIHNPKTLFMRGLFDQSFYAYKYQALLKFHPKVIALGSSRTMKFRSEMFGTDAQDFYNAGGMLQSVQDLETFSKLDPAQIHPKVILLGVDLWWLNDSFIASGDLTKGLILDSAPIYQDHLSGLRNLLFHRNILMFALELKNIFLGRRKHGFIGLLAKANGSGFRLDGSQKGNLQTPTSADGWKFIDRAEPPVAKRIKTGGRRFELTNGISPTRMDQLRQALVNFKNRGILVIGFSPPFSDESAKLMEEDPKQHKIWIEFVPSLKKLFKNLDLPFFDASRASLIGLDDRYMIDGFHGEEMFQVYLLRSMLKDPRVRTQFKEALQPLDEAIASPNSNYWYPDFGTNE